MCGLSNLQRMHEYTLLVCHFLLSTASNAYMHWNADAAGSCGGASNFHFTPQLQETFPTFIDITSPLYVFLFARHREQLIPPQTSHLGVLSVSNFFVCVSSKCEKATCTRNRLTYRISIYSKDEIRSILRYTIQILVVVVEMKKKPKVGAQIAKLLLEWNLYACLR